MRPSEQRAQPRIKARVPINMRLSGAVEHEHAWLDNLSWGGALLDCDRAPGAPGDTLEVELPYHAGDPIRIESEIIRVDRMDSGRASVAVRFASMTPEAEDDLEKVLELLLSGTGGGRRQHPRLAQRLEIYFDDPSDVRATLEDISRGGLAVTVPYAFSDGQSVQLTVFGGAAIGELRLRARVVNQTDIGEGKMQLYRIGLKFEHPMSNLEELVDRLLRKLASREAFGSQRRPAH
jgi:hypothetical protein